MVWQIDSQDQDQSRRTVSVSRSMHYWAALQMSHVPFPGSLRTLQIMNACNALLAGVLI